MNILIPDNWLRDYLKTKATPEQIKEYLSLCGPSVERINRNGKDVVYDIEITGNRPDAMSVSGIAREAAAILPRFGIPAALIDDPYRYKKPSYTGDKKLIIKTDPDLNPRWTSVVLTGVRVLPSPAWMQKRLIATGIRPVNNVVDITNYLMRAYGQPAHAFDWNEIKNGIMTLRASRKGEKIVTLDGKTRVLPGGDIVIEDGAGRLIDLCGIMGGYNSSIKQTTSTVVLFLQTYDPVRIRKTTMSLAHRTEAATLFEKGLDSELVLPALIRGVELLTEHAGARVASRLYDIYPKPFKSYTVACPKEKLYAYLGVRLSDTDIKKMLEPLGFRTQTNLNVIVPSWRRDVTIDVDIIEEVARIYGYHNIASKLPDAAPPVVIPDPELNWEQEIKTRLRDWGYTETYTYSMISADLMHAFGLETSKAYKILNPLSEEWLYMRPSLLPSMLLTVSENLHFRDNFRLFELAMTYQWRQHDLPVETPTLIVTWTGDKYREAKGLSEAIAKLMGTPEAGTVSVIDRELLYKMNIRIPVTTLIIDVASLVAHANPVKRFVPIPKYPPIIEDFSFVVPADFRVEPLIEVLSKVHKLIQSVTFLDAYENKRTFRVTYSDPTKTLTNQDIAPVHQKILEYAAEKFGISPVIG